MFRLPGKAELLDEAMACVLLYLRMKEVVCKNGFPERKPDNLK